jgi:hypothetical protein
MVYTSIVSFKIQTPRRKEKGKRKSKTMQSSFLLNENEEQSERNSQALQFMFKRQSYIYKVAAIS